MTRYDLGFDKPAPKKVMLGISGGVDSSVTAFLLLQSNVEVIGLTMVTQPDAAQSVADAAAVCNRLGIEHIVEDVQESFRNTIIEDFVHGYTHGRTPNPCILCNPSIKFSILYQKAAEHGCDGVATGHYAKVRKLATGRYAMEKAPVGYKDQSYFLYRLSQNQLKGLYFPLGNFRKPDVREIARKNNLTAADGSDMGSKPDSQDNCFVPDGNYAAYIEGYLRRYYPSLIYLTMPGQVLDINGKEIGTHKGLINYTIGQRKGFDVKTTERLFVIDRNIEKNQLIVGQHSELIKSEVIIDNPVFSGLSKIEGEVRLLGKIRHSAAEQQCSVRTLADGRLTAVFDQPVISPVTGQSCVFYDDDLIMAGGFISD
jgi:tRNA-specific 2-thiouridylase